MIVAIGVHDQRTLSFGSDKQARSVWIALWRQCHPHRRPNLTLIVPEQLHRVFDIVAIRIAQQIDVAVISQCHQLSILSVGKIVDVREFDRQLPDGKARQQNLHIGQRCDRVKRRTCGSRHIVGQLWLQTAVLADEILLNPFRLLRGKHAFKEKDFRDLSV